MKRSGTMQMTITTEPKTGQNQPAFHSLEANAVTNNLIVTLEHFKSLVSYRGCYKTNVPQRQALPEYFKGIIFKTLLFIASHSPLSWVGSMCLFECLSLSRSLLFRQFVWFPGLTELFLGHRVFFFFFIHRTGNLHAEITTTFIAVREEKYHIRPFFQRNFSRSARASTLYIYFYHGRGVIRYTQLP